MATILTVNPGSGSVRLVYVEAGHTGDQLHLDRPATDDDSWSQIGEFLDAHPAPDGVAHRLVHGGEAVREPTVVTDAVVAGLEQLTPLAPMHVPATLRLVLGLRKQLPGVTQVLCPDTAFHAGLTEAAYTYALPSQWRDQWGLRRYGFHGLSYAWALRRASELLGRPGGQVHMVAAHLGGGASVCAIRDGRSVDTSMGFTPLDGIPMSRRSGAVDPGMLLWLLRSGISRDEMDDALNHSSGLYGLSGGQSDDTRVLVQLAASGDGQAQLALDVYAHRVAREIAAQATSLQRIDALVFTGEIGWDQPEVREAICARLWPLGVRAPLDAADRDDDRLVSSSASTPVYVIQAQENLQLALEAAALLGETLS